MWRGRLPRGREPGGFRTRTQSSARHRVLGLPRDQFHAFGRRAHSIAAIQAMDADDEKRAAPWRRASPLQPIRPSSEWERRRHRRPLPITISRTLRRVAPAPPFHHSVVIFHDRNMRRIAGISLTDFCPRGSYRYWRAHYGHVHAPARSSSRPRRRPSRACNVRARFPDT